MSTNMTGPEKMTAQNQGQTQHAEMNEGGDLVISDTVVFRDSPTPAKQNFATLHRFREFAERIVRANRTHELTEAELRDVAALMNEQKFAEQLVSLIARHVIGARDELACLKEDRRRQDEQN